MLAQLLRFGSPEPGLIKRTPYLHDVTAIQPKNSIMMTLDVFAAMM